MTLVKICGLKDTESAQVAADNGADLLGVILVPNRARTVSKDVAKEISKLVKKKRDEKKGISSLGVYSELNKESWTEDAVSLVSKHGPYLVGVFRNQSVEEINELVEELQLDLVQLHGKEPKEEYIQKITVPVISRFVPNELEEIGKSGDHLFALIDGEAGGEGKLVDWDSLTSWAERSKGRYLLAGGLTPENVHQAVSVGGVVGVDVASGVENADGQKDHTKIIEFIRNAKR